MFVAIFIAATMMVGPSIRLGDHDLSPADSASAQTTSRVFTAGWGGFAGALKTLNPFVYTMGEEYAVIWPCYSFLIQNNEKGEMIGDLATKWVTTENGTVWHIWIVHTASFYDKNNPTVQQPLTVDDIIFTYWLAQNNSQAVFNYYFPELPGTGGRLIESMKKINNYEMEVKLRAPFAPFTSALAGIPIVPKYIWQNQAWNWANFKKGQIAPCIGSGAMYYGLNDLGTIGQVGQAELYANPTWFGTKEYGWQSHVYKYIIKSETDASNYQEYKDGLIDCIIAPTPAQYVDPSFPGQKFATSQGFVIYMSINQLSLEDRIAYDVGGMQDYNSQLVRDPVVAWALKRCVDKNSVVANDLLGAGSPADTLMPTFLPWAYHYGSTPGEVPIPNSGNTAGARQDLLNAGWHFTETGTDLLLTPDPNDEYTVYPLCKVGGTEVLRFRMFSPDNYPFWDGICRRIDTSAQSAGIDIIYGGPSPYNTAYNIWKTGDYELLVWDWWFFPPPIEPSLDVMEVYTSDAIGSDSDCNYHNASYDDLYYRSTLETDPVGRKALIDELQRIAYLDAGCWPIASRDVCYGIQTIGPKPLYNGQNWMNWGNWTTYPQLSVDAGYPWLFSRIYPQDNPSPTIQSFPDPDIAYTDASYHFTASVTDSIGTELLYRWNFGDGNMSAWSTSAAADWQYMHDGYYRAYMMVKENNTADGFYSYASLPLTVIDKTNRLPDMLAFTVWPSNPDSGTIVYFNGTARDLDGDPLAFTWSFGDNTSGVGMKVTHQFAAGAGIYTVNMSVNDGRVGLDPRPAKKGDTVQVALNRKPHIFVPDQPSVPYGLSFNFTISSWDDDSRDALRWTWVWGDGTSTSVTNTPYATHQYKFVRRYTMTVYADDLTGLSGHNVSDTGLVDVFRTDNNGPALTQYYVSSVIPMRLQPVVFTAKVTDPDGDIADVVFDFGDGSPTELVTQSSPNTTVSIVHMYLVVGEHFPSLTYTDGTVAPIVAYSDEFGWWMTVNNYFTVNLVAGWNFVSVPPVGYGYTAGMLGGVVDQVATWDPVAKVYTIWWSLFPEENDFAIEGSTGYWVLATAPGTLTLLGDIPTTPQTRAITVPSGGGWAIVGFNSFNTGWTASDIVDMYTGGVVDEVATWNPVAKGYTIWWSLFPEENDFPLVPGQAYWVLFTASGELTYTP